MYVILAGIRSRVKRGVKALGSSFSLACMNEIAYFSVCWKTIKLV